METIKIQGISDKDSTLKLEIPVQSASTAYEIIIVIKELHSPQLDVMGYPVNYFEDTYGSFSDTPLERNTDLPLETREPLE